MTPAHDRYPGPGGDAPDVGRLRADRPQIAVVGGSRAPEEVLAAAETLGAVLASSGAVVVCGGLGGVMAAACRGARSAGGLTVGLLPGTDPSAANPWVDVVVATGLGEARNVLVVRSAAAVVALGGGYGTLSEIALALRAGIPVVGIATWSFASDEGGTDSRVVRVDGPGEAAATALRLASSRSSSGHDGRPLR